MFFRPFHNNNYCTAKKCSKAGFICQAIKDKIKKGYLISQAPSCIIYLESESDMTPIYPQLRKTNKNSILNFARVGDAISFYYYDCLCMTEPQI